MNAATKLPGDVGPIHFVGIGGIGMSGIAEVIAEANDSRLSGDAAKRVLEAATLLHDRTLGGKPALDIAGNGRYARQLVEAAEQSRDMRLARSLDFDSLGVEQLSEISEADMTSAIEAVHSRLNIGG